MCHAVPYYAFALLAPPPLEHSVSPTPTLLPQAAKAALYRYQTIHPRTHPAKLNPVNGCSISIAWCVFSLPSHQAAKAALYRYQAKAASRSAQRRVLSLRPDLRQDVQHMTRWGVTAERQNN